MFICWHVFGWNSEDPVLQLLIIEAATPQWIHLKLCLQLLFWVQLLSHLTCFSLPTCIYCFSSFLLCKSNNQCALFPTKLDDQQTLFDDQQTLPFHFWTVAEKWESSDEWNYQTFKKQNVFVWTLNGRIFMKPFFWNSHQNVVAIKYFEAECFIALLVLQESLWICSHFIYLGAWSLA